MSTRRLVVNLVPISSGGGLQNALSFVEQFGTLRERLSFDDTLFLARSDSTLESACRRGGVDVVGVRSRLPRRLLFEMFSSRRLAKRGDVVFTLFGPPLLGLLRRTHNVNGCAYGNLFYPEIDFWADQPFLRRLSRRVIDRYRLLTLGRCDELIFETTDVMERALVHGKFKKKRLHLVEMSPSALVSSSRVDSLQAGRYRSQMGDGTRLKLLSLSGAHRNKRHISMVAIVCELKKLGVDPLLITTLPEGPYLGELQATARRYGVEGCLVNVGPVSPEHVASLIAVSDVMVNVALLESFSNNFVEAWEMGKPLIVTDSGWARNSCRDAALYVDVDDPVGAAASIAEMMTSGAGRALVAAGTRRLQHLPSRSERFGAMVAILEEAGR